jgi:hypothetical protein
MIHHFHDQDKALGIICPKDICRFVLITLTLTDLDSVQGDWIGGLPRPNQAGLMLPAHRHRNVVRHPNERVCLYSVQRGSGTCVLYRVTGRHMGSHSNSVRHR